MQIHESITTAASSDLRPIYRMHAELCKALANEHRQAILHAIGDGEQCVGDLAAEIGISVHNVSQHLAQGESLHAAELLDATRRQPTAPPTSLTPSSPAASASAPA